MSPIEDLGVGVGGALSFVVLCCVRANIRSDSCGEVAKYGGNSADVTGRDAFSRRRFGVLKMALGLKREVGFGAVTGGL